MKVYLRKNDMYLSMATIRKREPMWVHNPFDWANCTSGTLFHYAKEYDCKVIRVYGHADKEIITWNAAINAAAASLSDENVNLLDSTVHRLKVKIQELKK